MFSTLTKPVIFAHRGASALAPENSLAAFRLAVNSGVSAIELDVQLTADQEVVVFHDQLLDRLTDGSGPLRKYTFRELQQLTISLPSLSEFEDCKIPTLSEVMKFLPQHTLLNIELKNLSSPIDNLAEKTSQIIRTHNAQNRVLISSFNPKSLSDFKEFMPQVARGRLLHNPVMILLFSLISPFTTGLFSVHLPHRVLTRPIVRRFQDRALQVFAYTVNHQQDILNVINLQVDGFFTDDPDLALKLIKPVSKPTEVSPKI